MANAKNNEKTAVSGRLIANLAARRASPSRAVLRLLGVVALCALSSASLAGQPFDPFGTEQEVERAVIIPSGPFARACAAPPRRLSLAAALDAALCRDPLSRGAWAAARQQAAALGIAESAWLPTLALSGSESWTSGPHVDSTGATVDATQRTQDAAANLSWTLFDFGGRTNRIRGAHRLLDAANYTANRVSQQTILNVMQSYYTALAADADVVAAKTNEAASARSLEVARGRRSGGVATLADVLQAETAYDQGTLVRVQAEGSAHSARGVLAVAIGSTADEEFVLQEEAVPEEVPALTARIRDLMTEAMRQRPDLKAARAQSEAARANVAAVRASGRPAISLGTSHSYIQTPGLPRQNYNALQLNVSIPLWTGFQTGYAVRQALAAAEASDSNVEQVRLAVSLDVWNGFYALDSANQQLTVSGALSKSAKENEEVALGRYESGVGSIVDVLTAQSAAAAARHQRVLAELGWHNARSQLMLALGRLTSIDSIAVRQGTN